MRGVGCRVLFPLKQVKFWLSIFITLKQGQGTSTTVVLSKRRALIKLVPCFYTHTLLRNTSVIGGVARIATLPAGQELQQMATTENRRTSDVKKGEKQWQLRTYRILLPDQVDKKWTAMVTATPIVCDNRYSME
ncbi:hypothetical protein Y032_0037g3369 [Ancylostoma ceylanicum]|uniref:Uncharacterized protein n=1 Tax=Ancylostoma ceylanicum TaxID=53326 RepID=A0A016UJV0_9BILA|nr:hypothetical protein Y032_0037g3369 [Ancylostoma ceylanicum]